MTVYIDQYPEWIVANKPKWIDGGHLFGTDLNELHAFAKSLGLKREWFQDDQFPHYDLTANKRKLAIQKGAIEVLPGHIPKGVVRSIHFEPPVNHDLLEWIKHRNVTWRRRHNEENNAGFSFHYVPGEGDHPLVMLIGEAPGAQEDLKRRPFVGDSGLVLRELMAIAGLFTGDTPHFGEANCWLTNVIKFRPPRNRTPTLTEIMSVRRLLREEWIAVGMPRIVVPIGKVALGAIYGRERSILKLAGKPRHELASTGLNMIVFPMIHPSYGLRGGKSIQNAMEKDWEELGKLVATMQHTLNEALSFAKKGYSK